ncbi:MAG: STAS domain-containing protein [Acidimicrobiales bacterium]
MNFQMDVTDAGGLCVVVGLSGELDLYSAPRLRDRLDELVVEGWAIIVVDLDQLAFMDSSGISVLVNSAKRARASGGELRLVCTQARLIKLFEITGLISSFAIFATRTQAVPEVVPGPPAG